jgi:DNA-binding GntR family transcriptional regulator
MENNLREKVLQQVRAEIISGHSAPGTMYSVPTLATSLGVSTTPVREALLELSRGGLVEPMRNRGFKVVEPTLTDLRNLFDMRELLELYAAEVLALKRKKDLGDLRLLADEIAAAVESESVEGYLETDRRFHLALTASAENDLLTDTVMGLRDKMRLYGITSESGKQRQRDSVPEHYKIVELARIGDVDGLKALLRHHIRSWQPIFTDAILSATRQRSIAPMSL